VTREEVLQATREHLRRELPLASSAELGEEEPLLSAGVISSFDLVALTVFLERRFGVRVPDAALSRQHLDTLASIADLVLSLRGGPVEAPEVLRAPQPALTPSRAFPGFQRATLAVLVACALLLLGLDRLAGWVATSPWVRARVGDPRRLDLECVRYDDALARHELVLRPKAAGELRVTFQGDSGTYGVYDDASRACPAALERALAEAGQTDVRVYNVSYVNQSLVKDTAILEASLPYAPDLVILSLSVGHLDRTASEPFLRQLSHLAYNRGLFRRFLDASPLARGRGELEELDRLLAATASAPRIDLHRLDDESSLLRHRALLRRAVLELLVPERLAVVPRATDARLRATRLAHDPERLAKVARGRPFELDTRAVALLEAIIDRARAGGAEVAIFREPEPALPILGHERLVWSEAAQARFGHELAGIAGRKGVLVIDALDLLGPEDLLDTERHWPPTGHERIGRLLARELSPLLARLRATRGAR
jgi:acyl carrier protein